MNTKTTVRQGMTVLIGIAAFILGMGLMRFLMLFSRDVVLARASVEMRPGTNTYRVTLLLGSYTCVLMHRAEPLKVNNDRPPLVAVASVGKIEVTQSGTTLASVTNAPFLRFAPKPGFKMVEVVVVVSEPCYLNFGQAP